MDTKNPFSPKPKFLALCLALQAFASILAMMDCAEQHRAWKTALTWSAAERETAQASDASSLRGISLTALCLDIGVTALAFSGFLALGAAVAGESGRAFGIACGLTLGASLLAILFALSVIVYRIALGGRVKLVGPVHDYSLVLAPPIALAGVWMLLMGIVCIATVLKEGRIGRSGIQGG